MKGFLLLLLRGYKRFLSPLLPRACRFEPSCSVYMMQAIESHGAFKGLLLGIGRLGRCQPFSAGGFDPVPGHESALVLTESVERRSCSIEASGQLPLTEVPPSLDDGADSKEAWVTQP